MGKPGIKRPWQVCSTGGQNTTRDLRQILCESIRLHLYKAYLLGCFTVSNDKVSDVSEGHIGSIFTVEQSTLKQLSKTV